VRLEQRIVIATEMSGYTLPMNGGVTHPADVGARDGAALHADADEATRERVHDTSTPSLRRTIDSPRKRSTLQRLSVVWPMNANHDEAGPPGAGRECVASPRETTFVSMAIPNVCETMRAIRGQPTRGLRDLSSTMARMRASSGPFGPRVVGHGLEENSRRYLLRTNA
jgi:hypothetical protein